MKSRVAVLPAVKASVPHARVSLGTILLASIISACGDADTAPGNVSDAPTTLIATLVGRNQIPMPNSVVGTITTASQALDIDASRQPTSCVGQTCTTLQIAGNQIDSQQFCNTAGVRCTTSREGITGVCITRINPNDSVIVHGFDVSGREISGNAFSMCINSVDHLTCPANNTVCITN